MTSLPDATAACVSQAGLQQRARLLDAVWDDVQGARRSLDRGALPARVISSTGRGRARLERYAADVLCCPDGVWRVTRDHVQPHPGAWLLQAPVLAAFLPELCRLLLGETLRLPSLPVWWLGERQIWPALAANWRRFAIRSSLDPDSAPVILDDLPVAKRRALQNRVDADPCAFVAALNLEWQPPAQHVTYDTDTPPQIDIVDLPPKLMLTL